MGFILRCLRKAVACGLANDLMTRQGVVMPLLWFICSDKQYNRFVAKYINIYNVA